MLCHGNWHLLDLPKAALLGGDRASSSFFTLCGVTPRTASA